MTRRTVFIGHSHRDRQWLSRVQVFLRPQVRNDRLKVWDDSRIGIGLDWRAEIDAAISQAAVALLLVSPDFLASEFVQDVELPQIVAAAAAGELTIFCVHLSASPLAGSPLLKFQWANQAKPLDLLPRPKRNRALVEISYAVRDLIGSAGALAPQQAAEHVTAHDLESGPSTLTVPTRSIGRLFGVPQVPHHFVPRVEHEMARAILLSGAPKHIAITSKAGIGVYGLGGIGKTVIAATVARDELVRSAFPDGVYWLDVGERPAVTALLAKFVQLVSNELVTFDTIGRGEEQLRRVCAGRKCLVVLDDVWDASHISAFQALPSTCRMLFTTRDLSLIHSLQAREVQAAALDREQAVALVEKWAGRPVPAESADAHEVIAWSGGLPLALAITGAEVRAGQSWAELRRISRLSLKTYDAHPYAPVFVSIERSIRSLSADDVTRFAELIVFPESVAVPEAAILRLWCRSLPEHDARRLLATLRDKSLITVSRERVGVHDLTREYLRLIVDDVPALHLSLLRAHGYSVSDPGNFLNNDYLLRHLAYHLTEANRSDLATQLLSNFTYVAAKINQNLLPWLLREYRAAANQPGRPDYQTFVNTILLIIADRDRADRSQKC